MSQHDMVIANASGATVRTDLNNALAALVGVSNGASEPGTTYPYQLWMDTSTGLLKMRNGAGSAWVTLGTIGAAFGNLGGIGVHNFRLIKSGANLTLTPIGGNVVDIAGSYQTYTSMPTLGTGGLSADTNYYIYVYNNSGTAVLEASATAYTVDTAGRANKTGDTSRRLVGMARTNSSVEWVDSATQRLVISWANRLPVIAVHSITGGTTGSVGTFAEFNSADRVQFLTWGGQLVILSLTGYSLLNHATEIASLNIGIDGLTVTGGTITYQNSTPVVSVAHPVSIVQHPSPTEGYHYITPIGQVSGASTLTMGQYSYLSATIL